MCIPHRTRRSRPVHIKSVEGPIPMEYLDMVYGDKNIYSTPEDMLKWDAALRGGVLFKQSTLDSAYTPYSLEKPGKRNYGLGWRMIVYPRMAKS